MKERVKLKNLMKKAIHERHRHIKKSSQNLILI